MGEMGKMHHVPVLSRAAWGADERRRFADGEERWPPTYATAEALVVHHHEDRWAGAWHGGEWRREGAPAGSVEAWLQPAMRAVPTGRVLLPLLVEEAALWRRCAQLMAEHATGG